MVVQVVACVLPVIFVTVASWLRERIRHEGLFSQYGNCKPVRCLVDRPDDVLSLVILLSRDTSDVDRQHEHLLKVAHTFSPSEMYMRRLSLLVEKAYEYGPRDSATSYAETCWYAVCTIALCEGARPRKRRQRSVTFDLPTKRARLVDRRRKAVSFSQPKVSSFRKVT